ncbi:hypothetical protein IV102_27370 [bacterium]|nr:hypothetical protein [bacterium]
MASINPSIPSIPAARPLSQLSPVKPPPPPVENAPVSDTVNLQPPQQKDPVSPPRSEAWLKKAAFAGLGLGLLAGGAIMGGAFSPALSASQSQPQAHVQIKQASKNAPSSMLQEQTQPIHLKTARFGVTPTVRSYGDVGVRPETDQRQEAKPGLDGETLTHDIRIDRIHGADGHVLYSSDEAELGTLDFHDQADMSWRTVSVLKPAGQAGNFVSVSETTTRFSGGASDATETRLRTVDMTTHNVVNLSELLSGEDYQKIAAQVQAGLNSVQGSRYQVSDMETLDSHMNNGFALNQEKDGSLTLTVAIPSNVESDGARVAEFTFVIPASALQR